MVTWRAGLVGLVLLAACAPKEVRYALTIVTKSCNSAYDPFSGVAFVRVTVEGDGLSPLVADSPVAAKSLTLPDIPVGTNRVIEVRGYDADPSGSGAKVISLGRSLPFEVPATVSAELAKAPVQINVVLRKVGTFTPVASAADPTHCGALRVARAGHTATLLNDGRVFIAGGFALKSDNSGRVALADTEIFDPNAGTFTAAKSISFTNSTTTYTQERAFHTATLIPTTGQVVLWGGEFYTGADPNPRNSLLFYDPSVDQYGALPPRSPAAIARSRHVAATDGNGKLLIVGGIGNSSQGLVDSVEWFDPATSAYKIVDGLKLPRLEASLLPVKKGESLALAGGTDGTALVTDVLLFKYIGSTFAQQTTSPKLATPGRRAAAAASIRGGADMLLVGGFSDPSAVAPLGSSEIVVGQTSLVTDGPTVAAQGASCAAALKDGRVLVTGGRTVAMAGGPARASAASQLITANAQGGVVVLDGPALSVARYFHTCTALTDGTALVVGGLNEGADGSLTVLQDAWIYQPPP